MLFILLCLVGLFHGSFGLGETFQIRLADDSNSNEGRVEVFYNNVWGSVCDYLWDKDDARVVCRQLGLPFEKAAATAGTAFGVGSGHIWLTQVNCIGSESNLGSCSRGREIGINDCNHNDDAGVICTNETLRVRLVDGSVSNEGRLEVSINNIWRTVCEDDWDANDHRVVCRQLGFPHENAVSMGSSVFGVGSGQVWLDEVNCVGSEGNLDECSHKFIGIRDCNHAKDMGVICTDVPFSFQVRLADGSNPNEGRVEVFFNNVWGSVCDYLWDKDDARVVCRQLGLPFEKAAATAGTAFGEGSGKIWLTQVNCLGSENNLGSCSRGRGIGINDCNHNDDAGVICTNETLQVRLVNGSDSNEGRVELSFNNVWRKVCSDHWDANDARVVCRQLGLPYENAVAVGGSVFGVGSGQVWLHEVQCLGTEDNLGECINQWIGIRNCYHAEDAGVICTNVPFSLPVRLIGGSSPIEGQVEVLFNNIWGSVCDYFWDEDDARVVCRQLGLPYEKAVVTAGAAFGEGSGKIWLTQVNCLGSESNLGSCSFGRGIGINNCNHIQDAGVICSHVQVDQTTPTEIHINWSTFKADEDIDHFRVSYDIGGVLDTFNTILIDDTQTNAAIEGLEPNNTYTIKVEALTKNEKLLTVGKLRVTTKTEIIPVQVDQTTSTEVHINWSAFKTDGEIDHFRVLYDSGEDVDTLNTIIIDGTHTTAVIKGLEPGKTYSIQVEAFTKNEQLIKVGEIRVKTKTGVAMSSNIIPWIGAGAGGFVMLIIIIVAGICCVKRFGNEPPTDVDPRYENNEMSTRNIQEQHQTRSDVNHGFQPTLQPREDDYCYATSK